MQNNMYVLKKNLTYTAYDQQCIIVNTHKILKYHYCVFNYRNSEQKYVLKSYTTNKYISYQTTRHIPAYNFDNGLYEYSWALAITYI